MTGFRAHDPRTAQPLGGEFAESTPGGIAAAVEAACDAFEVVRTCPGRRRARWLGAVAAAFEAVGDDLFEIADRETALGSTRLRGEWARTCAQVRAFETLALDGSYVEAVIDSSDPDAVPPRGDLRKMNIPIGPVAVFAASNFPFAFSVPGGDTVSALTAGCPVVVKAHPSHPATSRAVASLMADALAGIDAPPGLLGLVEGAGPEVGRTLVLEPGIAAVAFTGSRAGGRALYDLAATRPVPIPVYAEMGSINPVFVTRAAITARCDLITEGLAASMLNGTGQFCTSPGLIVVPVGEEGDTFVERLCALVTAAEPGHLLNAAVRDGLAGQVAHSRARPGVTLLAEGPVPEDGYCHPATLLATDAATFAADPDLAHEHFGPVSLVVRVYGDDEVLAVARAVPGSLTATVHVAGDETASAFVRTLRDVLAARAGRLVWNGYPTGVAIALAMHHGGPYPATTNAGFTSVGQGAVRRFLRPVTYQDAPGEVLPAELQDGNPLGIARIVNSRWQR